ncbi:hypothetical protein [Curtobacterium sp. 'Ferrero']|uniref:hypothetical protein n=1 Tax=Curtobacterium sp. 'Ferrero' TaxID=2033654 RepID=UPI0020D01EFA|nr:hypothetical protein [Curtobacterium sp. 'Ferrero']
MTVAQSHGAVERIFAAVQSVVGEDGWTDEQPGWFACGSGGKKAAQYTCSATRKLPLPAAPDEVASRVVGALEEIGYGGARVQRDETLVPPRPVIAYPNGYNRGAAADGFLVQFQAYDSHADVSIEGHCVSGKAPEFGTPLNPRPTDLP